MGYPKIDLRVREPIEPPLDYYAELHSHLAGGYPQTAQQWEELKIACSQVNIKIGGFLNEISKEVFFGPSGYPLERFWEWNGKSDPAISTFILLEDIVFLVWLRLEDRVSGTQRLQSRTLEISGPKNVATRVPLTGEVTTGRVYELEWKGVGHPTLVRASQADTCQVIKSKIEHVSDSTINLGRVKDLVSEMNQVQTLADRFQMNLQGIRSEIDLGNNLKGDCKVCRKSGLMG